MCSTLCLKYFTQIIHYKQIIFHSVRYRTLDLGMGCSEINVVVPNSCVHIFGCKFNINTKKASLTLNSLDIPAWFFPLSHFQTFYCSLHRKLLTF